MGVIVLRPSGQPSSGTLASIDEHFLVLTASAGLTNERVLVAGPGISFIDTGPGGSLFIQINEVNEVPSGALDGVNTVFTLTSTPNPESSLKLYVNGVKQASGSDSDYVLSGSTITMEYLLISRDNIFTDYFR